MKKTVIITGASGNLGKAAVDKFIAEGYSVVATVSPGKTLGFSVDGDVTTYEADLTNEMEVAEVISQIVTKHTSIHAAVLLVGGFSAGGIAQTDGTSLKKMYTLNFETSYFVARPTFLQMQQQPSGGKIILVGARPALNPAEGKDLLAYSLSKSLLFKLAEFLNAEGSRQNIVTSVIVPGVIDTMVNRKTTPDADFSAWVTPEAIAETLAFICSDAAAPLRETIYKVYGRS
jgi:NAD(P)-dependent dehydrogenase (short-subunit alcohol dehydrogenase family)